MAYQLANTTMLLISASTAFVAARSVRVATRRLALVLLSLVILAFLVLFHLSADVHPWGIGAGVPVGIILAVFVSVSHATLTRIVFGATGLAFVHVAIWFFAEPTWFPWEPTVKTLLVTWSAFAGIGILVCALGVVAAVRLRRGWPLSSAVILFFSLFVNAWLFVPMATVFLLGSLAPSGLVTDARRLKSTAIYFFLLLTFAVGHYLLVERLWFHWIGYRSHPEAVLIVASPVVLLLGGLARNCSAIQGTSTKRTVEAGEVPVK